MKMKKYKARKGAWFVKVRHSYLPASRQGMLVYFLYMAYLISLVLMWYQNGHDVWNLLVFVVPLSIAAALVTQYIASRNS